MPEEKRFAKHSFFRRIQALWIGNPAKNGARFREAGMTSDDWMSPFGAFQVYCVQADSHGLVDGGLRTGPPELLFDADFQDQVEADRKFEELVREAEAEGFRVPTMIDIIDFQAKAQEQKRAKG